MSVALSSGGGAGGGLSMAAMAHNAGPSSIPSGPSVTNSSMPELVRSQVAVAGEAEKQSPQELARSVAPILAIAPGTGNKSVCYAAAGSDLGAVATSKFPKLTIDIADTKEALKALKKFVRKNGFISAVFENALKVTNVTTTKVVAEKADVKADVGEN